MRLTSEEYKDFEQRARESNDSEWLSLTPKYARNLCDMINALQQENAESNKKASKARGEFKKLHEDIKKFNNDANQIIEMYKQQLEPLQGKAVLVVGDMPETCSRCKYEFPFPVSENIHYESHCGLLFGQDASGHWLMMCIRKDKRECERLVNCPLRIVGGGTDEK